MTPHRNLAPDTLTGAQRAAVLLVSLGTEAAGKVLKCLRDEEVEKVSIEIARFRNIASDLVVDVLMEYRDKAALHDPQAQGGLNFAKESLHNALGPQRAEEIMMKVEAAMEVSAFHLLQAIETDQIVPFLQREHPQTIALILSNLHPRKAAEIVSALPTDLQSDVIHRLATLTRPSADLLRDVEDIIRQQIGQLVGGQVSKRGGVEAVANILNNASRTAEREIMDSIRARDMDLANAIKDYMFVFDDLVQIDDRDMQRLLMEVDQRDLALALKAAGNELKEKLLTNISDRAADAIKEEMELMGPVRISEVEEAQLRILEKARDLEEQEALSLAITSKAEAMV